MVLMINEAGFIGQIILGLTNLTGSVFLTLLFIMILLIVIALAFRFPVLLTSIIYLPLLITLTATTSGEFIAIFGCTLIYLGVILAELILPPGQ